MSGQSPIEKPQVEGTELANHVDGSPSDATDQSLEKTLFIKPEPMREDQVQNAVKFLSHPRVRGSPVIYRRSFLEKKGLTKEEIDEAFRRVPDPPSNATTTDIAATSQATQPRPPTSLPAQAPMQTSHPIAGQGGVVSLVPASTKPRLNWSHTLIAIGVLSASGAGTAVLFKKVVLPKLKSWIRRVAMGHGDSVKEDKSSKSLAEEAAEAAKAAASAAAIVAQASQELLNSKNEERKYFEAFMGMIDVQVKEMKSISDAVHKLGKEREQDNMTQEYAHSATVNGSANNSWRTSQVNQADMHAKVNGTPNSEFRTEGQLSAPSSVEPMTAPHSKSYMEIMAMIRRGERPPNIREINDMPPNPNQQPSEPVVAPKPKPWDAQLNGKPEDAHAEPWWRKKSVKITELEPEGEEPSQQLSYNIGTSERSSPQHVWVPPQPPSVAIPEAAAAIRHPKPSPPIPPSSSGNEVASAGGPSSGADVEASSSVSVVPRHGEIEEEQVGGIEVN